ncbi:MAG: hypothetical protein NXI00_21205 [Cytophagales bacterium]|nr:hypothetical protein [Cytophagales bacterium]
MKFLFKLLGFETLGIKIATYSVLALAAFFGVKWAYKSLALSHPFVKEIVAENAVFVTRDSVQVAEIDQLRIDKANLRMAMVHDSLNFLDRVEEFQITIKDLTNRAVWAEKIVNEYREKAPCVDYKGLFKKQRVYVDCPE